jgi:hypothetical protein
LFYMSLMISPSFWVPLREFSRGICREYHEYDTLDDVLAALDRLEPQQLETVTRTDMRTALRRYKRYLWWEGFILPIFASTSSSMLRYVRLWKAIKSLTDKRENLRGPGIKPCNTRRRFTRSKPSKTMLRTNRPEAKGLR